MKKPYIALISSCALRDTEMFTGPGNELSWDGPWVPLNDTPAFLGIYHGEEEQVREAAAGFACCDKEFIQLLNISNVAEQSKAL